MYILTYIYIYVCIYLHTYIYMYVYTYIHTLKNRSEYLYVCMCVCICVCVCVNTSMPTHTCIYRDMYYGDLYIFTCMYVFRGWEYINLVFFMLDRLIQSCTYFLLKNGLAY